MKNRIGFIQQTADDYAMSFFEVKQIYDRHKDNFYSKLEQALEERRRT